VPEYKAPAWARLSNDLCASFFEARTPEELREKAIDFDGEGAEPGHPDPDGMFYLHHLLFRNLQAQADLHHLLSRGVALLEGIDEALADIGDDAEKGAKRVGGLHKLIRNAIEEFAPGGSDDDDGSEEGSEDNDSDRSSEEGHKKRQDIRATHIPSEHFEHPIPGAGNA
jgi:hypothetical protein